MNDSMKRKLVFILTAAVLVLLGGVAIYYTTMPSGCSSKRKVGNFYEIDCPTKGLKAGKNKVCGVVLHHTACMTMRQSLDALTESGKVSCHVTIDRDGTRYILASPEQITMHAGYSYHNGMTGLNRYFVGIEFQSIDTHRQPLTNEQIESAIDYLLPIIKKHHIRLDNIVTHEQVRTAWLKRHPDRTDIPAKVDISQADYQRFMAALRKRMGR